MDFSGNFTRKRGCPAGPDPRPSQVVIGVSVPGRGSFRIESRNVVELSPGALKPVLHYRAAAGLFPARGSAFFWSKPTQLLWSHAADGIQRGL